MRESLTSSQSQFDDTFKKIDQNDPKQLMKIIGSLIHKSKTIISTLDSTVARLQKVQKQKQYWKNSYLRFREACQKYINADGVRHFKHLVDLQQQLKKVEIQKNCLKQSIIFKKSKKQQTFKSQQESKEFSEGKREYSATKKRRQKFNKSISTISFNRENLQSEHRIVPKKICLVPKNSEKSVQDN